MSRNTLKECGVFRIKHYDDNNNLKWEGNAQNSLFNEGEFLFLDVILRNGPAPSAWHIGLFNNNLIAHPAETSTLSDLKIPINFELDNTNDPGYSERQQIDRNSGLNGWSTLSLDNDDYQAISRSMIWQATSNWTHTIRWLFLTTNGSITDTTGKLVSIARLSTDLILSAGDKLSVAYSIKLQ